MNKEYRGWPSHLFGGRVRTSTAALVVAFLAVWFVYETYQPAAKPAPAPATQVVPPGFVPDPNYTWVPRTSVWQAPTTTYPTTTTTTTTTTTSPTESTTTTTITSPTSPGASTTTPPVPGLPFAPPTTTSVSPGPGPAPGPGPGPSR